MASDTREVHLGSHSQIFYLSSDVMKEFEDVRMVSNSGQVFNFNRCVLAAQSRICYKVFRDVVYQIANSDETLTIVTNCTTEELMIMSDFFLRGKTPGRSNDPLVDPANNIDSETLSLFHTFGVDLTSGSKPSHLNSLSSDPKEESEDQKPLWIKSEEEGVDVSQVIGEYDTGLIDTILDYPEDETIFDGPKVKKGPKKANKANKRKRDQTENNDATAGGDQPKAKKEKKTKVKKEISQNSNVKETYFYFPQTGERDLSLPFQCHRCIRGFKDVFGYRQHFHRHDLETPDYSKAFVCIRCDYFTGSSQVMLADHGKKECAVERHDDENSKFSYYCYKCDPVQKFKTVYMLTQHVAEKHENAKVRICPICGTSLTKTSYSSHMKTMHGDQNIKCSECPATFKHQHIYTKHFRNKHTIMTCEECGKQFHLTAYRYHVKKYHTPAAEMKYCCKFCNKGFVCKSKYLDHLNIHTGEKPHTCKFCPRKFSDACNKIKHMREAHTEQFMASKKK